MFYRHLLITCLMYGLVTPVWAEPGQGDLADTIINPVLEELETQENSLQDAEAVVDIVLDPVTTYQTIENATDIVEAETPETSVNDPGNSSGNSPGVSGVAENSLIKDIVLVLDNSGSMKKNDPKFLTNNAVTEFINNLDESTRAAIVIFDQDVRMAVPLTDISPTFRQGLLDSLSQINYKGLYTNSPAAIESAIYDLKNNGREEARKIIVFMTDGIVDTGNADRDLEKTKWLKEDLAADAADAGIRIFGIAFTENADFELIQSLAQKTKGEYYRALLADDLQNVFSKLNALINKPDEPEIVEKVETRIIEKIVEKVVEPKPEPIIVKVPASEQVPDESERKRSVLILVALAVLILAVIAMVLMLLRGNKSKSRDEETAQEAYLNDIHGITKQASFALGNKPAMLGRVAGKDTEYLNYFVIPEMADSGMTVISKTVIAGMGVPGENEATLMPGRNPSATSHDELDEIDLPEPDFDFDITGTADSIDSDDDEEDTVMRGDIPAVEGSDGSDETIMLDDDSADEDVMEGYDDDDATIRPN
jgi:uncharacterized protein YegL